MGSEKQTWRNLRKAFEARPEIIHVQRFEDSLSRGIPDLMACVNGVTTFIELKQLDAFPARPLTPIRFGLSAAQRIWILEHQRAGGNAVLVTQIGREYFIINDITRIKVTQDELRRVSTCFKNSLECVDHIVRGLHGYTG